MVAAQIVVAAAGAPGNGQAGDDAAGERGRIMRAQRGRADAVAVVPVRLAIEPQQPRLPLPPASLVLVQRSGKAMRQAGAHAIGGFRPGAPEAQRHRHRPRCHLAGRAAQIELPGEGDVAILGAVILLAQLAITPQHPPAIACADKPHRAGTERHRGGHGDGRAVILGEQHLHALVGADPARVVRPAIDQMRREQREQAQRRIAARAQFHLLQHHVAPRIGDHRLEDVVATGDAFAAQAIGRHAIGQRVHAVMRVALLLGEEPIRPGDDETEIAQAGLVEPRVVDLVQDAVAEREPDPAERRERGADAELVGGSPGGRNAGVAGSLTHGVLIEWLPWRVGRISDCPARRGGAWKLGGNEGREHGQFRE